LFLIARSRTEIPSGIQERLSAMAFLPQGRGTNTRRKEARRERQKKKVKIHLNRCLPPIAKKKSEGRIRKKRQMLAAMCRG
jgi:hypothetical protein